MFFHVDDLVGHLIASHEAKIEIENLNFDNVNASEKFKADESLNKNISNVLHRPNTSIRILRSTLLFVIGMAKGVLMTQKIDKKRLCKPDGVCLSKFCFNNQE